MESPQQASRVRPIGIKRLPSSNLRQTYEGDGPAGGNVSRSSSGRGRSTSAPQHQNSLTVPGPSQLTRQSTRNSLLPTVVETPSHNQTANQAVDRETMNETTTGGVGRRRSVSNAARSVLNRFSDHSLERQGPEYESEVYDVLDVLGR